MKKLSLIVLYCLLVFTAFSQIFPTHADNPEWVVTLSAMGDSEQYYSYTTRPEQEICGEIWTPIQRKQLGVSWSSFVIGYYRVEGESVYFRYNDDCTTNSFLLYDFSLELSDTILLDFPESGLFSLPHEVVMEDSLPLPGSNPRRINLFHSSAPNQYPIINSMTWVQGIGNISGNPFPIDCIPTLDLACEVTQRLNCFIRNGEVVFSTGDCHGTSVLHPNPIHVDVSNIQTYEDGSSWFYAFRDLSAALEIALPGDTVYVAEGTYLPYSTELENIRTATFEIPSGVVILGGFAGDEDRAEQRDFEIHPTILSGDIGVQGDSSDNAYHVLYGIGLDSTTLIDGFEVINGTAFPLEDESFENSIYGGGLLLDSDEQHPFNTPRIQNCRFTQNSALYGGAIACLGTAQHIVTPVLNNCFFFNNDARVRGGAVYKSGHSVKEQPFFVYNCTFESNTSGGEGGGMALLDADGGYNFKGCFFLNNEAVISGGGLYIEIPTVEDGTYLFDECHFTSNISSGEGGGFTFIPWGVAENIQYYFSITRSSFTNNTSNIGAGFFMKASNTQISLFLNQSRFRNNYAHLYGSAMTLQASEGSISSDFSSCRFTNNETPSGTGGAIHLGNFTYHQEDSLINSTLISNSLFVNNSGALKVHYGYGVNTTLFQNCTFVNNGVHPFVKYYSDSQNDVYHFVKMQFQNSIVYEPQTPLGQVFFNGGGESPGLYNYELGNCLLPHANCTIPGGDEACGEGMIYDSDPMFADPQSLDFRVMACSPAINSGSNEGLVDLGLTLDLAGNPRILDGVVDMGAYERDTLAAVYVIVDASSSLSSDGSIVLENILGGTPPYQFFWEDIQDTLSNRVNITPGIYNLIVSDADGCSKNYQFLVSFPDDTSEATESPEVIIYPNALGDDRLLHIEYTGKKILNLKLYNSAGILLAEKGAKGSSRQLVWDLSRFPSGVYFVKWNNENGMELVLLQ